MPEIQISRKTLKTAFTLIVVVILLAALAAAWFLLLGANPGFLERLNGGGSPPDGLTPDALAAAAGVSAFYTLDYTQPAEEWQADVCATLTPEGCQVFQFLYAPGMRRLVEERQVQTGCTAQRIRAVEEGEGRRVWLLEVTLENPWEGAPASDQVYAEVVQGTDSRWLMTHILFGQEAERFQTPAP